MSGVDFSDEEKAQAWLERQSVEVRCAIACRAALRVCANICRVESEGFSKIALSVFRAALTSAVRGSGQAADEGWLTAAANSASRFAGRFSRVGSGAAHSAALSAANSTNSAETAFSVADSADSASLAAGSDGYFAAYSAATKDSGQKTIASFAFPLWQGVEVPPAIAQNHQDFLKQLKEDRATWGFWHDWYLAMWEGRFTDWDLAVEVAKIPNEVWDEGAEAVAKAIREIEARRASDLPRPDNVPELERSKLLKYVERLLAAPEMTALAAEGAAATLQRAITEYLVKAEVNSLPDELSHLEGMPALFQGISKIVKSREKAVAKARHLADQIEALNAKVAKLEAALKAARAKTVHGLFKQLSLIHI